MIIYNALSQRRALPDQLLLTAACIIFALTAINSIFYSIIFAFDGSIGTYIFRGDLLADYFKVLFSYPHGKRAAFAEWNTLPEILRDYVIHNPYGGIRGLNTGTLSHFHLPPFTTAVAFLNIDAFNMIGIRATLWVMVFVSAALIYGAAKLCAENRAQRFTFIAISLLSYPFIFALQRGNFFSLFSVLFIVWALTASNLPRFQYLPPLLFALAVNIRPNLIFLLPLLYFLNEKGKLLIFSIFFTLAIFFASLLYVEHIYPDYTLANFLAGLQIYKATHVLGDGGFGYSTSLYTLLKLGLKVSELHFPLELAGAFISLTGLLGALYFSFQRWNRSINDIELGFALVAIMTLTTPVFADYHLLIYLTPIILFLKANKKRKIEPTRGNTSNIYIVVISAIMLSPLNYWEYRGLYVASLIKTLIIFSACLTLALKSQTRQPRGRSTID